MGTRDILDTPVHNATRKHDTNRLHDEAGMALGAIILNLTCVSLSSTTDRHSVVGLRLVEGRPRIFIRMPPPVVRFPLSDPASSFVATAAASRATSSWPPERQPRYR